MSEQLVCAVCLYDETNDEPEPALTVVEGYAVCGEHLGFVAQGVRFAGIIRAAREEASHDEPGTDGG